jgi:hypothetical protein
MRKKEKEKEGTDEEKQVLLCIKLQYLNKIRNYFFL